MKTLLKRLGITGLCVYCVSCAFAISPQLTVQVRDRAGAPVVGALVIAIPSLSSVNLQKLAITDSVGNAVFSIDPNVPYGVYATKHGMTPTMKDQFNTMPLSVITSGDNRVVTFLLQDSSSLASTAGIIRVALLGLGSYGTGAGTLVMADVSNAVTHEQVAFSGTIYTAGDSTLLQIPNVPAGDAGSYQLSLQIPARQVGCSIALSSAVAAGEMCQFAVSSSAFVLTQMVDRQDQPSGNIAFEGIVTDLAGAGLKDCTVTLWKKIGVDWNNQVNEAEVRTDFTGHFAFYDVAMGTYAVQIIKAGYEGFWFNGYNGYGMDAGNPLYRRISNDVSGNIKLDVAQGVLTGYVKMYDGEGGTTPVPFAEVNVWPDWSQWPVLPPGSATSSGGGYDNYYTTGTEHRAGRTNGHVRTGIDGRFTIGGLGHGNYQIGVNTQFSNQQIIYNNGADGQSDWNRSGDDLRVTVSSDTNPLDGWKTVVCDASGATVSSLDVYVGTYTAQVGKISGTITFDVAQQTVDISSMTPLIIWAYEQYTGENRQYKNFFKVISGNVPRMYAYEIDVATGMKYQIKAKSRQWGSVTYDSLMADLEQQASVNGVDLRLFPAGSLRGIVRLPDGKLFKPSYSESEHKRIDVEARGITVDSGEGSSVEENGVFEILGLVPGTYQLSTRSTHEVKISSMAWSLASLPWPNAVQTGVVVRSGQETYVEMQLQNGAVVTPRTPAMPPVVVPPPYTIPYTRYAILKFPSATGASRSALASILNGGVYDFERSVDFMYDAAAGWKGRTVLPGRYDFHLARIDLFTGGDKEEDEGNQPSDHYCVTFISQLKNTEIKYDALQPAATTYLEFESGTLGQSVLTGAVKGATIFTPRDVDLISKSGSETFIQYIPSVMLYDTAGQLKAFSMALPKPDRLPLWDERINNKTFTADWLKNELSAHPVTYRIERLPAGDYVAVFETPNYPPMMRKITLSSGEKVFDVNFDSNVIVGSGVSGVVKSTGGVALPDVMIVLTHRVMTKTITTDASGAFSVTGLPPGTYRMTINKPGYAPGAEKFGLGREPKSFANGSEIILTRSDAIIQGTVYSQKMPAPKVVAGAKIVAYNESYNVAHPEKMLPVLSTKTDEQGQFLLEGLVSSSIYKVFVISPGKLLEWKTFGTDDNPLLAGTTTQAGDFVLKSLPPRLKITMIKIYENGRFQYQFLIESPKKIINPSNPNALAAPYCRYSPVAGASSDFVPSAAVEVLPMVGPELSNPDGGKTYSYSLKIPVLDDSEYYKLRIEATDGSISYSEDLLFGPKIEAKSKKDIKEELAEGGTISIDDTGTDATQITVDAGSLTASGEETSTVRQNDVDIPIGGFLSAMPNFNLSRTGSLKSAAMARIKEEIIASDVYEVGLADAQMNRSLSLNLRFDVSKVSDSELGSMLICFYNPQTDRWEKVRGAVTIDPITGVVSVDVDTLAAQSGGTMSAPSAGRSVVRKGMYAINRAAATAQSGVYAVFKQDPSTAKSYTGSDFAIFNFPNPFDLKSKNVTLQDVNASFSQTVTGTMLKYSLSSDKSGHIAFYIYNLAGELVREMDEGTKTGGFYYYTEWDGKNDNGESCASGVYFLIAKGDGEKLNAKPLKIAIVK